MNDNTCRVIAQSGLPSLQIRRRRRALSTLALVLLAPIVLGAQTKVTPPKNKYTPEQDVEIGLKAAEEARKEFPVIDNDRIDDYLDRIGARLVEASPAELNNHVFQYSFTPLNLKEINAFALPGGPMFVNRGMVEAASREGEVAGVMAHELAHVLLRHGTANATKAQGFQIGALAGAIAGAVVGGGWGELISQGSQFGLGTWLMKYSREYEKQADLLGAQIMARAGYDPRDLGRMFETIQKSSKSSGGPEWMSSHPDPGNRSQYIAKEASMLQIARREDTSTQFESFQAAFNSLSPARSMSEPSRNSDRGEGPASVGRIGDRVPPPATQYRTAQGGRLFQVNVPTNWQALSSNNSMKFVPQNAYGPVEGQTVFTHGVELGVARAPSRDLREATDAFIDALARANPGLRAAGDPRTLTMSRRTAIGTPLVGQSALGSRERIGVYTTFLSDGNLFYYLTVVPEEDASSYAAAFERVGNSIRLNDGR
ncbi:MAG: M48 family metallopeptidase [Vicinamibacterales bacterium]